jgi:hypothetical protein
MQDILMADVVKSLVATGIYFAVIGAIGLTSYVQIRRGK